MADSSVSFSELALPLGVILGFALLLSLGVYVYYKWNKARLARFRDEGEEAPPERAVNEIARVKGIERVLAEQGTDTSAAQAHIAGAERRLREGDTADALARAKLAKEALMQAKGTRKEPEARAVDLLNLPPPSDVKTEVEEKTLKEQLMEKVPKNFLESRFAMETAEGLIQQMRDGPQREEADRMLASAREAFEAADYDKAFTMGCKARRMAGAQSVIVSESETADKCIFVPDVPSASDVPVVITKSYDKAPEMVEERPQGESPIEGEAPSCPSCGEQGRPGDSFCRKCGSKLAFACGSCGKEAREGDRFCRGCGEKLAG